MQTFQAHSGANLRSCGQAAGKTIELAPGVTIACFSMSFSRNEEVFAEEEEAEFVYKVISGAVRDVRILSDGRRQIGAFHLPGDVFGLEYGAQHRHSAEAVVDSVIALVRRTVLEKAANDNGAVSRELWRITARDLEKLQDHLLLLGRKTALERVATFLVDVSARGGVCGVVDLPMARMDIADYLGLTIETVSRTMTQLERDHAISMPSTRRIVLHGALARDAGA